MRKMKKILAFFAAMTMAVSASSCSFVADMVGRFFPNGYDSQSAELELEIVNIGDVKEIKNVILMIGDGMGPNQIKMGELYKKEALFMQKFPYSTKVETCSANSDVTDSAAAATALATGVRTDNGKVGMDALGTRLDTIVDSAKEHGKSTGILATEELHGATPMGFSGHSLSRGESLELLQSAAESSNVNLFASYTLGESHKKIFTDAGYKEMATADEISEATEEKIFGTYKIRATALSMSEDMGILAFDRLVTEALEYLSKDEDGFFLMAEGSHIDHGGHNNDIAYMLNELVAFDDAVKAAVEWADKRDDTVVIVTADHETGGLILSRNATKDNLFEFNGQGEYANFQWTTKGHTNTDVYCFINGANVDFSKYSFGSLERIQNTDIFQIMKKMIIKGTV